MCLIHECFTLKAQLCLQPREHDAFLIDKHVFNLVDVKPLLKACDLLAREYGMQLAAIELGFAMFTYM